MGLKIIYNKIAQRLEVTSDIKAEFFKQTKEQIKSLYSDIGFLDIGGGKFYNYASKFIPNLETVARRFIKRTDDVLVDEVAGRNATPLYPVSSFDGVNGQVLYYTDSLGQVDISMCFKFNSITGIHMLWSYGGAAYRAYIDSVGKLYINNSFTGASILTNNWNNIRVSYNNDGSVSSFTLNGITYTVNIAAAGNGDTYISIAARLNGLFANMDAHGFNVSGDTTLNVPLPHLGYGFDQNGEKVDLTVLGGVTGDYHENGSTHLIDKGVVERSENRFANNQMVDSNGDGLADGLSSLSGKGDFSIVTGNGFSGNAQRIEYDTATGGAQSLNIFDILETGKQFEISFFYRTNVSNLAITDAVNALEPDNPSPRLKVNTADAILYSTIVTYKGTNNDIYFSSWLQNEGDWFEIGDIHISKVEILPNNNEGQPIVTLQEGDVFISGSNFINKTDFMIDMSRPNGAESENFTEFTTLEAGWTKDGDTYNYDGTGVSANGVEVDGVISAGKKYIVTTYSEGSTIDNYLIWSSISFSDDLVLRRVQNGYSIRVLSAISNRLRLAQIYNPICFIKGISVKLATPEILFFDKSDASIWKDAVRSSIYYNSNNPFEWHSSELTQEFIEDNIQPDALNKFWSKDYKDLFLYINALTAEQQVPANKYVS